MKKSQRRREEGKNKGKRKETWHFSHTLSCRLADIIIVKLGGRFRLSCRCGSLKSHSMSPCHFSSTSLPSNPSFTHSALRARGVRKTACPCLRSKQENVMAWSCVFFCVLAWRKNITVGVRGREMCICVCVWGKDGQGKSMQWHNCILALTRFHCASWFHSRSTNTWTFLLHAFRC